jgi:small subunit ribosomal protein S8
VISDPIADMLTRMRNAIKAKFKSVDIPASKLKICIADVLKDEGFIKNAKFVEDDQQGILRIYLKYGKRNESAIIGIKRISKPSRRIYIKRKGLKPILNGMGIMILSTSKGIITDSQARKENVGGEALCTIW